MRRNPADPGKVREALEDPAREPIPDEAGTSKNEKPPIPSHSPTVGFGRVRRGVIVKCVEQGAVDEISGPNHGGRPDEETTCQTSETITGAESRDSEQELESPSKVLLVELLLSK